MVPSAHLSYFTFNYNTSCYLHIFKLRNSRGLHLMLRTTCWAIAILKIQKWVLLRLSRTCNILLPPKCNRSGPLKLHSFIWWSSPPPTNRVINYVPSSYIFIFEALRESVANITDHEVSWNALAEAFKVCKSFINKYAILKETLLKRVPINKCNLTCFLLG